MLFGGRGEEEEEEYDEDEEEEEEECSGLGDFSRSSSPQVPTVVRVSRPFTNIGVTLSWLGGWGLGHPSST